MKNWRELNWDEKQKLIDNGSINWCGASKGLDLDPILDALESSFSLPDTFASDIKTCVCYPHDYAYLTRSWIWRKVWSDIEFGLDLSAILSSYNISFIKRMFIICPSVITLLLFWMKAYNS